MQILFNVLLADIFLIDVHEIRSTLRRSAKALNPTVEALQSMSDFIFDGLCVTDSKGTIVSMDVKAADAFNIGDWGG